MLVPVVTAVLAEFVPDAQQAMQWVAGRVCLVDGTITLCWSYAQHRELWSRKHATTGFTAQLVSLLNGSAVYISDPVPGKTHDAKAFTEIPVAKVVEHSNGGIGDNGYQGYPRMITPRKKPPGGELSKTDNKSNAEISALWHLSNDSSRILSQGGSFTPTTAAPAPPTKKPTMLHADCSSSQSSGVSNNV